jgi:hypothetical protein
MRIDLETLLANSMFANHVQIFATTNYLKEVGIMGHNLKFYKQPKFGLVLVTNLLPTYCYFL